MAAAKIAELLVHVAEIVQSVGIVRAQRDGVPVLLQRFARAAEAAQRVAQIECGFGMVGFARECFAQERFGCGESRAVGTMRCRD